MFLGQSVQMVSEREDWPRLASYVVSARVAAGWRDRRAFATATGVTERTLGNLERGIRVAPETLAIVEAALDWKPGSARTVLSGGEPVATDGARTMPDDPWASFSDDEKRIALAFIETLRRSAEERDRREDRSA